MSRRMGSFAVGMVVAATLAASFAHHDEAPQARGPALAAGELENPALLRFRIEDPQGMPIAGRLTFLEADGTVARLFPNFAADPQRLAIRENVIYALPGTHTVTIPPGEYRMFASHGLEWSRAEATLRFTAGEATEWTPVLRAEVDSRGWISGDFHLHTLTHSGHGDSNLEERIISLIGEGVEFAVATDHNHNTDYRPTIRALGTENEISPVTGNEVTTDFGHFNVFPLDPERPIPDPELAGAQELFPVIRAEPNAHGVVPVIQLNHPRWEGIDYFGFAQLDPITATASSGIYSADFDSLEVFNENNAWGFYDAEVPQPVNVEHSRHWVLRDWFNLLNRGHRAAAVGNSDSHHVARVVAGYPRNFVRCDAASRGSIDPRDVVTSLRAHRVFTTLGPFVEYTVNGKPMGSEVAAPDGTVTLHVRVQAASWVDCDRIRIYRNGDLEQTLAVPDTREPLRFEGDVELAVARDCWITLVVEGDDSLAPIVPENERAALPLACTNPVWINAEDPLDAALRRPGEDFRPPWTSPWKRALRLVQLERDEARVREECAAMLPTERGLVLLAAAETARPYATALVREALGSTARPVLFAAARAAETLAASDLAPELRRRLQESGDDPYLQAALLRALGACAVEDFFTLAIDTLDRIELPRYGDELEPYLGLETVPSWQVLGLFPAPDADALRQQNFGPEEDPDLLRPYRDKHGREIRWEPVLADLSGHVDLARLAADREDAQSSLAYAQSFVFVPEPRRVGFALGSDDGCQLYVDETLVLEDLGRHAAHPLRAAGHLDLAAGWNRILVKVENQESSFGFYFRTTAPDLVWTESPDAP